MKHSSIVVNSKLQLKLIYEGITVSNVKLGYFGNIIDIFNSFLESDNYDVSTDSQGINAFASTFLISETEYDC